MDRLHRRLGQRGARGPVEHDAADPCLRNRGAGGKDHRHAVLADIAAQIREPRQDGDDIGRVRLEIVLSLHRESRAMPAHVGFAIPRRDEHELTEILHAARLFTQHLVELQRDLVRLDVHGAAFGLHGEQLRRKFSFGATGRITRLRAAEQDEGQDQAPHSAFTLPSSCSRRADHSTYFRRSASTTSGFARCVKFAFWSLAVSAASCFSSCARSLLSRAHSRCRSTAPASEMITCDPSFSSACAFVPAGGASATLKCARARLPMSAASRCSTARAAAVAPTRTPVTTVPGGTLYSARTCRTAITLSRTSSNSRAGVASPPRASGHDARARNAPAARPGNCCQSVSVMNGTTGCNSRSAWSNAYARTARATSRSAASPPMRGFVVSRYQSASSFQTNRRALSTYSLRRSPATRSASVHRELAPGRAGPSAASHSAMATSSRPRIQWSARLSRSGAMASSGDTPSSPTFVTRNRPMFCSLVTKLRPDAKDCSRFSGSSMTSAPMPSPPMTVYRSASAP